MGKRPFYRKIRRTLYETVSDSGNSVLRYRGHDDKEYYVASSNDPNIGPGGGMIEVTWQELKNKRDAGELTPGSLYRITDYQCTTTQENTRSAGHQFDIVLLALSENKLAEEGWAMMHDTPIYDVILDDGTYKCYYITVLNGTVPKFIKVDDTRYAIDEATLAEITIDEATKTITFDEGWSEEDFVYSENGYTYNYFQNSNLSAWKVWYCLDNDTSRFAWADNRTSIITTDGQASFPAFRKEDADFTHPKTGVDFFGWHDELNNVVLFTTSTSPSEGELVYDDAGVSISGVTISNYNPNPNGRGVIYRLIDEWNNDVPYDFKNIMLSVGTGKDAYGYLFSRSNYIGDEDYSINGAFVNVSIAQYPTYTGDEGEFINAIELGILAPSLRTGERLQDIKIASGILTSNEQIGQLSSHSIMGYSIESPKESSKT